MPQWSFLRMTMATFAALEIASSAMWIYDPKEQERKLGGLLMNSGCTHSTGDRRAKPERIM